MTGNKIYPKNLLFMLMTGNPFPVSKQIFTLVRCSRTWILRMQQRFRCWLLTSFLTRRKDYWRCVVSLNQAAGFQPLSGDYGGPGPMHMLRMFWDPPQPTVGWST